MKSRPGVNGSTGRLNTELRRVRWRESVLCERRVVVGFGWMQSRYRRYVMSFRRRRVLRSIHARILLILIQRLRKSGAFLIQRFAPTGASAPIHRTTKASSRSDHRPGGLCRLFRREMSIGIVGLSRVRGWWLRWRLPGESIWIRIVCQRPAQLILGVVSKRFSKHADLRRRACRELTCKAAKS